MATTHRFSAVIEDAGGGGAFVTIPFDVERAFGKKRVPVRATIDGVPYRGSLVRMGGECHILGILKSVRAKREETRQRRIVKAIERLAQGQRRP